MSTSSQYRIVDRAPTLTEYREICTAVGWEALMNFAAAEASLRNSLHHVVALSGEQVVGMGRIVGDGAIYFYIQDLAVRPEHQHHGVGGMILSRLLDYLKHNAPGKAFIGLFAASGTQPFYERHGFGQYAALTGMFQVIPDRQS